MKKLLSPSVSIIKNWKTIYIFYLIIILLSIWLYFYIKNTSGLPYYTVDSYSALVNVLKDDKDIIIPDMNSELLGKLYNFEIDMASKNHRIYTGYGIVGGESNSLDVSYNYETIRISCTVISRFYTKSNPPEKLNINTKFFGVDTEYYSWDQTGNEKYRGDRTYPLDSFVYSNSYQFDYLGCRYSVSDDIIIPPDQSNFKNPQTEVLRIESEEKAVIQSIIEKGSSKNDP